MSGKEYDLKANTDYNSPEKRHDVHHISHGQWVIRTPDPACSRIEPGKDTEKRIAELKFTCGGITYYSGTVALGTGAGGNGLLVDLGDSLLGSSLVE